MKIDIERLKKIQKENSRLIGITSIVLNDSLVIENIRILMGENGPFIAMPTIKTSDGNLKEIIYPTTEDLRMEMTKTVLETYYNGKYEQKEQEEMHVTDVIIHKKDDTETNIKAMASVLLNNELAINCILIVEDNINGEMAHKIYMPTWQDREETRNLVYAINNELKEEIINKIFDEFKN